eukprot:CAMPEP_0175043288 /NCGR_PEP_ID=MMETSP0052_2-20121109/3087_1 /TAXON_ID=51329 ORGANISM="Polytomella parva, Strain SAG 63-3" /NCGR_SAMPLE_ID=MMETSP0052_2 /ASSEMBLY_ACC=CAM_ASM_000194 /LENGTH=168 /DNA_ID=CAMNT_0016306297 /DNA_START=100 /DNA_END=607 /DNA_ORIENTATION=-
MPPKKGADLAKAAKLADKDNLARAETEILSLQKLLEIRSHEALEAKRSEKMWRERMEAFTKTLEQHKEDTLDITADMTRQYKGPTAKRVNELEEERRVLKQTIEERNAVISSLEDEKEKIKRASEAEIQMYEHKVKEMQVEFAQMLRDTLDRMHDRLSKNAGITADSY